MAQRVMERRELYAPGHFGNWYEMAGRHEMRDLLAEASWWGFNWYADWFDTVNLTHDSHLQAIATQCWLKRAVWEKKKMHFLDAQKLGMKIDLVITPNHVYADQVRPEWRAQQTKRTRIIHGHLVCPSCRGTRKMILDNYREIFEDLRRSGIQLDALTPAPYDFGGCGCAKCHPWMATFGHLSREIHEIARTFFPRIETRLFGWFWESPEHDCFAEWADRCAPGWIKGISLWVKYGEDRPASVPPGRLPQKCRPGFFIHLGYPERLCCDRYGIWGPVVAPDRIPRTLASLDRMNGDGFMAYSEGLQDDVNMALVASLSSGKFATADEVLQAYARRYFRAGKAGQRRWARWLAQWGHPFEVDLENAETEFRYLAADAPQTWRLSHWTLKLRLLGLNWDLERSRGWSPRHLAKAEAFFREKELLQRNVYGLAPLHEPVFGRLAGETVWFGKYVKSVSAGGKISSEA